jgi:hypothetical protein
MLQHISTKYEWVYILEADERMTPALFAECLQAIETSKYVGYYVAERVMFMNHWIRHSTQYPRYQLRLLRKDKVWFTDYGHTEREVCNGTTGFLKLRSCTIGNKAFGSKVGTARASFKP